MAKHNIPVLSDFSWQPPVEDKDLETSPAEPSKGDRYIVATNGGDWSGGAAKDITYYDGAAWQFDTPLEGWISWVKDENCYYTFDGDSWGASLFADIITKAPWIDVRYYDADPTGVSDSTIAINAAIAALSAGDTLFFPNGTGYKVTAPLSVLPYCNVVMKAPIIYSGSTGIVFQMGEEADDYGGLVKVDLYIQHATSDWATGAVGAKLVNLQQSNVRVIDIAGFEAGLLCEGSTGHGFAYNKIFIDYIRGCKYGLDLYGKGDNSGWVNQNSFFGGAFAPISGVGAGANRWGIRLRSDSTGVNTKLLNTNVFYQPCIQIGESVENYDLAMPILIQHGLNNRFIDVRSEANHTSYLATIEGVSRRNYFSSLHDPTLTINETGDYGSSILESNISNLGRGIQIFKLNWFDIYTASYHNAKQYAHFKGMFTQYYNASVTNEFYGFKINSSGNLYVDSATAYRYGVGIYIDTNVMKRFNVAKSSVDRMRMFVTPYDADGAVLDGSGAATYVWMSQNNNWDASSYDGGYRLNSNSGYAAKDINMVVASTVKKIKLVFMPITNADSWPGGLTIYSLDGYAEVTTGLDLPRDKHYADASPHYKDYKRGEIVYDMTPASSGKIGYSCVNRVETVMRVGALATDTTMEVDSTAGMTAGDNIGVVQDDNSIHWTTIASVTDGDTLELTAGLTDDAAVDNAVYTHLWKPFGVID